MHRRLSAAALLAFLGLMIGGCGKRDDHAGHTHATHAHQAPHGGTLVELGEHAFSLEFVRDAAAGKLTAYVLDGHAANFIRLKASGIEITATVGGEKRPLSLRPVANTLTGETVGDTAQFEAQADWLKTPGAFTAELTTLEIRGARFERVAFKLP